MYKSVILLGLLLLLACQENLGRLTHLADLPPSLNENSGMVTYDGNSLWLLEDSGNKEIIYKVDLTGHILQSLKVKHAKNVDWEDLATDRDGNLYIADIGNNNNKRKNLVIYKLPHPEKEPGDKIGAQKIKFHYPEQKEFPPKKSGKYFDAEALFHWGDHLYIVTKNRAKPFDCSAFLYKVPDTPGEYTATLVRKISICEDQATCQITAMDITPDGKKVVALSYGKLFLYTDFVGEDFTQGKKEVIDLWTGLQLEAVCFKNDSTLLLSDERTLRGTGGNLYLFSLPN
jgi:hypothetical protein